MLSLEDCRALLGPDAPADDSQLAQQREEAYCLARLLVEIFLSNTPKTSLYPPQQPPENAET
jgi:hypothetical protein